MVVSREELEREFDQLRTEYAQHQEIRAQISDLLGEADERRRQEAGTRAKWDRVISNLETCLREAKARLTHCEVELFRVEKRLDGLSVEKTGAIELPPELEEFADIEDLRALTEDSLEAARKILGMPLEDIAKLNLEEVAELHNEIEEASTKVSKSSLERLRGRLELANQFAESPPDQDLPDSERRRQHILRAAIEKIRTNQIDYMTEKEIKLILASYTLLTQRLSSIPKDERLKRILGAAVNILRRKLNASKGSRP